MSVTTDAMAWAERVARSAPDRPATMRVAMLVDPSGFGLAADSASDNVYMQMDERIDRDRAHAQLGGLIDRLASLGVDSQVFVGVEGQDDGVFPNNAFATVPGRLIAGSMRHEVRRREAARQDIRAWFAEQQGYELVDLSAEPVVAELTGVAALDRPRGAMIVGASPRVDEAGCRRMHEVFEQRATLWTPLVEGEYHLNIVCALLAGRAAVVHDASFPDEAVPAALDRVYDGRVVHLSDEEKAEFAGNCISVTPRDVLMSARAEASLRPASRATLAEAGFTVHGVDVDEFEKAGGSLRCLIAEIF